MLCEKPGGGRSDAGFEDEIPMFGNISRKNCESVTVAILQSGIRRLPLLL